MPDRFDPLVDDDADARVGAGAVDPKGDLIRVILERYSITDPTAGREAGTFATAATQDLYNKLLADGSTGVDAASTVARTVESTDVTDVKSAVIGVTAPDVLQVYANLLAGSQHHLVAFGG